MRSDEELNRLCNDRLGSRQVDELIGLARGLCADGEINQAEVEFLSKWLAANLHLTSQPLLTTLYQRVSEMLSDGIIDPEERSEIFELLRQLGDHTFELGEVLKATTLPLCSPAPAVKFEQSVFTFTGTFSFGKRSDCERAAQDRGAFTGSLTRKTNFLVIGLYATESWKHSSFGNKILKAVEMREAGTPLAIISEEHWTNFL